MTKRRIPQIAIDNYFYLQIYISVWPNNSYMLIGLGIIIDLNNKSTH